MDDNVLALNLEGNWTAEWQPPSVMARIVRYLPQKLKTSIHKRLRRGNQHGMSPADSAQAQYRRQLQLVFGKSEGFIDDIMAEVSRLVAG